MTIKQLPRDDQRETERASLHVLEHQYAWIQTKKGDVKTRIIDFSPFGLGVVLEELPTRISLVQGDRVSIQLQRDGQEIILEAALVTIGKTTILKQLYTRLGFKIINRDDRSGRKVVQRSRRFALNDIVELSGHCEDPSRPGQKAFFTIRDLSIRGLLLETSARNKFLLPGLKLAMTIAIPGSGSFSEVVSVRHVHPLQDRYLLGCEFEGLGAQTMAGLGAFCLNFGKDVSYQIMVDEGFPSKLASIALTVHTTASYQDFMQITRLRLDYEHAHGRHLGESDPWQMIDEHDDDAQHICVKLGKKVVASARLVFNQGDRKRSGLADTASVPTELWSTGFATVSKVAIEPEFEGQRSYVFSRLWIELFRLALQSQMASMLIVHLDAWPKELLSLGFKPLEASGTAVETIFRLDLKALLEGRSVRFTAWSYMIAPLSESILRDQELTITKSLALKFTLARGVRSIMLRKLRRNEDWRALESRESQDLA